MRTYDVQTRRGPVWKTDSTYDDRELAEQRARQFEATATNASVRVVEEVFDDRSQKYKRRTVYRDSKFRDEIQTKIENSRAKTGKSKSQRPGAAKDTVELAPGGRRRPPAKSPSNIYWIFGVLVLIVGLGAGAMMALEHFRNLN